MSATLRGGLSLGLSGFTFWSHDMGGFAQRCPPDLYARWATMGFLSSHARSHGAPPKEPWEYSPEFLELFRNADNMRYELMPYIYAQAKHSSENGLPMMRALFVEYPDDPGAWLVDNEYLFGADILVAPLFTEKTERDVYLPGKTKWIDYQTGETYNPGWHQIKAGKIPVVMLVREGAVIPHIKLAQSTLQMDWSKIDLKVYGQGDAKGFVCLPADNLLKEITVSKGAVSVNPFEGKTKFRVVR
jgi:alpha-D-xyloside xylohydrolase